MPRRPPQIPTHGAFSWLHSTHKYPRMVWVYMSAQGCEAAEMRQHPPARHRPQGLCGKGFTPACPSPDLLRGSCGPRPPLRGVARRGAWDGGADCDVQDPARQRGTPMARCQFAQDGVNCPAPRPRYRPRRLSPPPTGRSGRTRLACRTPPRKRAGGRAPLQCSLRARNARRSVRRTFTACVLWSLAARSALPTGNGASRKGPIVRGIRGCRLLFPAIHPSRRPVRMVPRLLNRPSRGMRRMQVLRNPARTGMQRRAESRVFPPHNQGFPDTPNLLSMLTFKMYWCVCGEHKQHNHRRCVSPAVCDV